MSAKKYTAQVAGSIPSSRPFILSEMLPSSMPSRLYKASLLLTLFLGWGCAVSGNGVLEDPWLEWKERGGDSGITSAPGAEINGIPLALFHSDWFAIVTAHTPPGFGVMR
jgi:hypothetical protein